MSNAHHFKWSSRILREVGVPLDDLLIRATTELEEKQNVLLPALVTVSNTDSISFSKIRISIRPQYHYKQLLVRFKDIDGNVSGSLTDGRQFFAAQRVYDFRIPLARLNGVVRVDILGKRESGTDSNQVYIYVPAAY